MFKLIAWCGLTVFLLGLGVFEAAYDHWFPGSLMVLAGTINAFLIGQCVEEERNQRVLARMNEIMDILQEKANRRESNDQGTN